MRVAVNIEFTDEELRKYAEDVGRRWVVNTIHSVIQHLPALKVPPGFIEGIMQAASTVAPEAKKEPPPPDPYEMRLPDKCTRIEASPVFDDGWMCHKCGVTNNDHRVACRQCMHERCDMVMTPPPNPSGPEA